MIYNMPKKLWRELYRMLRDSRVHVEGSSEFLVDNWLIKEYGLFSIENDDAFGFYKYRATDDVKLLEFILRYST